MKSDKNIMNLFTWSYFMIFTEEPVVFTIPLKDVKCVEHEEVTLECEISKPDRPLLWQKDGEDLPINARFEVIVDGCSHRLVINDAQMDDAAEFTVRIGDQESMASLDVEGQIILSNEIYLHHQMHKNE